MRQTSGHIRLHRKLQQNPIWTQLSPAVLKVFLHFIFEANWKPAKWYDGTKQLDISAGSFVTSYKSVAEDTNLSQQQVRDAFAHLEKLQIATYSRTPRYTLVSLVNYTVYQFAPLIENTEQTTQGTGREQAENRQGTPVEEFKNSRINTGGKAPLAGGHLDDLFQEFCTAYRKTGAPLVDPEDFQAARRWEWGKLDAIQRMAAVAWLRGYSGDPTKIKRAKNFLEGKEWNLRMAEDPMITEARRSGLLK